MTTKTLDQVVRAAVIATAIATFQDVQIARAHPSDDLARTVSHVKGQYDAFNRLMQVNPIGTATLDSDGRVTGGVLDPLVFRYMYDGLGRLVRKTTLVKSGHENLQSKDYYYDGVRRIQEVVTRAGAMPAITKNDELPEPSGESAPSGTATWTDREYVWGPDYVDECVVQIDRNGTPMYVMQDGNFNMMGLVSATGAMLEQYAYDPYGTIRVAETYSPPHAVNRIGHQGLFYDRFDGTMDDPSLEPNAVGLYYNRNRSYAPHLGRFMQRDPNATALAITGALTMNGKTIFPQLNHFAQGVHYENGLNLYEYEQSDPSDKKDPAGLDLFEDAESAAAAVGLNHAFAAVTLFEGRTQMRAGLMLQIAYMHAAFMWDDFVWDQNEQILFDLIAGPFFSVICFVEGTVVATPVGPEPIECLALGREITSREDPHRSRDVQHGIPIGPDGLSVVRLQYAHSDGSMTTMEVLRPTNLVASLGLVPGCRLPVSLPEMGVVGHAEVLAVAPYRDHVMLDVPIVTGCLVTDAAQVLNIFLEGYEQPIGVTPKHPVFSADRQAWVPSAELQPGERLRTASGIAIVACVEQCPGRAKVYNVEVSQDHTYFVGDAGVWAHNPCELSGEAQQLFAQWKNAGQLEGRSLAAFRMGGDMKLGSSHFDVIRSFPSTNFSAWEHGFVSWINRAWVFRVGY